MKKVLFILCLSVPLIAMDPASQPDYGSIQPPAGLQMPNRNQTTPSENLKNYVTSTPFKEGCLFGCCGGLAGGFVIGAGTVFSMAALVILSSPEHAHSN